MSPVVVVVGATGGIGREVSLAYARRGARLVLVARSPDDLEDLAAQCRGAGTDAGGTQVQVEVARADVTDGDAVEAAFARARQRFGRVDVVVHTAAVVAYGRFDTVPAQVWDRVVEVGLTGTANVARSALAAFAANSAANAAANAAANSAANSAAGGTLVVVGSVLGEVTVPLMGAYVTAKWGVRGLVRVLQQEARTLPGVRVMLVSPGAVGTPIYDLAANYAGRIGRPPPPVYRAKTVARAIVRAADHDRGRRSRGVGVANPVMRLGFSATPWLYDALVGPLMRVAGLRRQRITPHPGNVFAPSQEQVSQQQALQR